MNKKEIKTVEKEILILKSVKLFLENDYFISDIAAILNKSTSTIQRYLNDPYIENKLGEDVKNEIKNKLEYKKIEGRQKGGKTFALNNEAIKLKNGKFCGARRK